ncbi:MAG: hydrolase [Lentisphaerae bacterium]|nr:hydrolase [Lentisphaerota bacterium]
MLLIDQAVLVIVDVQGRLAQMMYARDRLFDNLQRLVKGAQALAVPILLTEQNPTRMGETIPELRALLKDVPAIAKLSFGCAGDPAFLSQLDATGRQQVLLAGIESHVCMYQTVAQLVGKSFQVQVVADAVSSRTEDNYRLGLERMRTAGASLTSVESALFELMQTAAHPAFKTVLGIVK